MTSAQIKSMNCLSDVFTDEQNILEFLPGEDLLEYLNAKTPCISVSLHVAMDILFWNQALS